MKNKVKVMLVGPVPPPLGGIALYVKKMMKSKIIINSFNLELFNTAIPEDVRSFDKRNERSYFSFLSDGLISGFRLLLYVFYTFFDFFYSIKKNKPKIVHIFTNSYWGFWRSSIYLFITRALGIKVIFHLLNAIDDFWAASGPASKRLIQLSLKQAQLLIVQSESIKSFVSSVSDTPCNVIYNGVDNDISKKSSDIKNGKINLIFIGSLTKNKGVFDIIDVASKMLGGKYIFTFIGTGPRNEFLDYSNSLGVQKITDFRGPVSNSEKINLLKKAHILLLPSYAEGQPVAILEGMAAGLPIISTNVGSIPEIVTDEINGFIIEPGDTDHLCDCIIKLSSNQLLYNEISKNNINEIKNKYRIERVHEEIVDNYKSIIN